MVPIFRSKRREIAEESVSLMSEWPDAGFKALLRADGMDLVGLITARGPEIGPGMAEPREVVKGVTLDGDTFEEYLDRRNPESGKLESAICFENSHVVVTARKEDPASDDEDNFRYLQFPPAEYAKKMQDDIERWRSKVNDMRDSLDNAKKERDAYKREADRNAEMRRELEEEVEELNEQVATLKRQKDKYESQLRAETGEAIKEKAKEKEEVERAADVGTLEGKSEFDQIRELSGKMQEAASSLKKVGGTVSVGGGERIDVLMNKVDELSSQVENIEERMEGGE